MILKKLLKSYIPRGELITNEDIYNGYGSIPVYSATTTGAVGYYRKSNYITTPYTMLVSNNGNAGFVSLLPDNKEIWFGSDCGILELEDWVYQKYNKEIIAVWLQDFFIKNRHVNGTQPKFSLSRCINKDVDLNALDNLKNIDFSEVDLDDCVYESVKKYFNELNDSNTKNTIKLKNFINGYIERGKRLVIGRDLYTNYGNIKVISSTTTGPMGYYTRSNYELKPNDFLYTIDGANAGYVLLFSPQSIFITDHAGVISVKDEYNEKYGKVAIALLLQDYFVKKASKGTQPTFLLKNNLELELDLNRLHVLSKMKLDKYVIPTT